MAITINVTVPEYVINVTLSAGITANVQSVIPSGVINGVNTVFTLPFAPTSFLLLISDRQPQVQGTALTPLDYYVTGTTITMTVPPQESLFALEQ